MRNSTVKQAVHQQFSQVAANYSTSSVHAQGEDLAEMVARAQLDGSERVLDAGCGAGHTALAFAPNVAEVVAIDLSDAMLQQCRHLASKRNIQNVDFRVGDVEKLDFADDSFDLVVSRYSAHHWPRPQQALAEFARVLRPNGRFMLSDIVSFDDFTVDTHLQAIELLRDSSHVRDHSLTHWVTMMNAAGFHAQTIYQWGQRLEFTSWVKRMQTPAQNIKMIRQLFDGAPAEVREALFVENDHSFTFQGAVILGQL